MSRVIRGLCGRGSGPSGGGGRVRAFRAGFGLGFGLVVVLTLLGWFGVEERSGGGLCR